MSSIFYLGCNGYLGARPDFSRPFADLPKQDRALIRDLILINYPPADWREKQENKSDTYDVVIIGGGMAGLTAGAALFKEGIYNIKIFDQNSEGLEGPWVTYARMKTLRSTKEIMGPALGIPHLTFHAWFEAIYGAEAWKKLAKIPNRLWMDYLTWYRQAMSLPVENNCLLNNLSPSSEGEFELEFVKEKIPFAIKARKVVLATGRAGFGGPFIPDFVKDLPSSTYAHTIQPIDFSAFNGKKIGIIGVGSSSFDAAAAALESNAEQVDLLMRRKDLPNVNKFACLPYKGFNHGYYYLKDEDRLEFLSVGFDAGIPPPVESVDRIKEYPNFRILANRSINKVSYDGLQVHVETNKGNFSYDFLILGTGYCIDGSRQSELKNVFDQITLWKDHLPKELCEKYPKMINFPYLGPSYEFIPKNPDAAPYLKNLYCYNYGAILSHGLLSSDIPAISLGATRLAQGIAADFFVQDKAWHLECLKKYNVSDFEQNNPQLNIE